jgi:IclR family acetate operon transcriptional repressor
MGFQNTSGLASVRRLTAWEAGVARQAGSQAARRAKPPPRDPSQVQSLTRALALLNALAESVDGMSLGDLAQVVGLAPSTAHRLLTTLQGQRFVRFIAAEGVWQVGVQAFIVGQTFRRARDVIALARPAMRRLMEESGETVNLYIEEGGEAVCMGQVECRQVMRAISRPGGRVKMHCSGVGKAMLARLPEGEVTRILQAHGLPRMTERTLDTPRRLRADLEEIRRRGFAVDDEEHAVGMRCVAAAILDEDGRPLAALSLSGPVARIDDAGLMAAGVLVAKAADTVTAQVGGRPSL